MISFYLSFNVCIIFRVVESSINTNPFLQPTAIYLPSGEKHNTLAGKSNLKPIIYFLVTVFHNPIKLSSPTVANIL